VAEASPDDSIWNATDAFANFSDSMVGLLRAPLTEAPAQPPPSKRRGASGKGRGQRA
jgi:hypothetical protein